MKCDNIYFSGAKAFNSNITEIVKRAVNTKGDYTELEELQGYIRERIDTYDSQLKNSQEIVNKLESNNEDLFPLSEIRGRNCTSFGDYTQDAVNSFISEVNNIHVWRKKILGVLDGMEKSLVKYLEKCSPDPSSPIAKVYYYNPRLVTVDALLTKDVTVILKKRSIAFSEKLGDNGITITEGNVIAKNTLRIRAFHTLIPEFAIGTFYTFDLTYPQYGTKQENGKTFVSGPTTKRYPVIAAAHLNLGHL